MIFKFDASAFCASGASAPRPTLNVAVSLQHVPFIIPVPGRCAMLPRGRAGEAGAAGIYPGRLLEGGPGLPQTGPQSGRGQAAGVRHAATQSRGPRAAREVPLRGRGRGVRGAEGGGGYSGEVTSAAQRARLRVCAGRAGLGSPGGGDSEQAQPAAHLVPALPSHAHRRGDGHSRAAGRLEAAGGRRGGRRGGEERGRRGGRRGGKEGREGGEGRG